MFILLLLPHSLNTINWLIMCYFQLTFLMIWIWETFAKLSISGTQLASNPWANQQFSICFTNWRTHVPHALWVFHAVTLHPEPNDLLVQMLRMSSLWLTLTTPTRPRTTSTASDGQDVPARVALRTHSSPPTTLARPRTWSLCCGRLTKLSTPS